MVRQRREWYPGAIYHIMARGSRLVVHRLDTILEKAKAWEFPVESKEALW